MHRCSVWEHDFIPFQWHSFFVCSDIFSSCSHFVLALKYLLLSFKICAWTHMPVFTFLLLAHKNFARIQMCPLRAQIQLSAHSDLSARTQNTYLLTGQGNCSDSRLTCQNSALAFKFALLVLKLCACAAFLLALRKILLSDLSSACGFFCVSTLSTNSRPASVDHSDYPRFFVGAFAVLQGASHTGGHSFYRVYLLLPSRLLNVVVPFIFWQLLE